MGTRADFYIGRGEQAEWLGSTDAVFPNMKDRANIAWDKRSGLTIMQG